jgi:hypothetical protein
MNENLQLETILEVIGKLEIPHILKLDIMSLELALLNRYQRKYYQSTDRKYRITLDSEIEYYHLWKYNNTFMQKSLDRMSTIVELKYAAAEDRDAEKVSSHFPFRISKISKYVNGVERFNV